jgi:hypothetical protein
VDGVKIEGISRKEGPSPPIKLFGREPRLPPKITTPLSASLITDTLSDSWSASETHSEIVSLAPELEEHG